MCINYFDLKPRIIELANLSDENLKLGVSSTPLKIIPAFFFPDGGVFYITTDHYSADFYEDFEKSINVIGKRERMSLEDFSPEEVLKRNHDELYSDYRRFRTGNVSMRDVRYYLNLNCVDFYHYVPDRVGDYSDDCSKVLLSLTNGKLQIYKYFLKLISECDDVIGTLKKYPQEYLRQAGNKIDFNSMKQRTVNPGTGPMSCPASELNYFNNVGFMQDFGVLTMGIDKVENKIMNTITTSRLNPYEYYFNYVLMGYNIVEVPRIIYDKTEQVFRPLKSFEHSMSRFKDDDYREEAELIKRKVPIADRHVFFK